MKLIQKFSGQKGSFINESIISFLMNAIGLGLMFLLQMVLARMFSSEDFGLYSLITSIFGILGMAGKLGFDTLFLRQIPKFQHDGDHHGLVQFKSTSYFMVVVLSLACALLLFGIIILVPVTKWSQLVLVLPAILFWFIFKQTSELYSAQHQAHGRTILSKLSFNILPPGLSIMFMGVTFLLGDVLMSLQQGLLYLILAFFITIALLEGLRTVEKGGFDQKRTIYKVPHGNKVKEWLRQGARLSLVSGVFVILSRIHVLIISFFVNIEAVGQFNIAATLAGLSVFGLQATNQILAPRLSKYFHSGQLGAFNKEVKQSAQIGAISTLVFSLPLILGGKFILSFFGEDFIAGYPVLLILTIAQFVNSMAGPVGYTMTMTGKEMVVAKVVGICALLSSVMSIILTPKYGLMGGAIAAGIGIVSWNLILMLYSQWKFKINTSIFKL